MIDRSSSRKLLRHRSPTPPTTCSLVPQVSGKSRSRVRAWAPASLLILAAFAGPCSTTATLSSPSPASTPSPSNPYHPSTKTPSTASSSPRPRSKASLSSPPTARSQNTPAPSAKSDLCRRGPPPRCFPLIQRNLLLVILAQPESTYLSLYFCSPQTRQRQPHTPRPPPCLSTNN